MTNVSIARIALKGLTLFAIVNMLTMLVDPLPALSRVSPHNALLPGRKRLPWGERPELAYNLTTNNLDALFATHEIARPKAADEFRVVLIGDSSTWGFLLRPEDTLSEKLNTQNPTRDGKRVVVYNLGYPDFSLAKDSAILLYAERYQPDMVIWLTTLRSLPNDAQDHALLTWSRDAQCQQPLVFCGSAPSNAGPPLQRTLVARRREWADWLRLQLFSVAWAATGIDQHYPADYEPARRDFDADIGFRDFEPRTLRADKLAYPSLRNPGPQAHVPLIVVNEPMLVSTGANGDLRYNAFYPRWAYDQYREQLAAHLNATGVRYLDYWDLVPEREFTNSAVHLTPTGSQILADRLARDVFGGG